MRKTTSPAKPTAGPNSRERTTHTPRSNSILTDQDAAAIKSAASEPAAIPTDTKLMIETKTIHDILSQAGIHKVERKSHDESGAQYFRGIIGYKKETGTNSKGELHAGDCSLVDFPNTLAEFKNAKNKTTIDFILHDATRQHFTRLQIIITPSKTADVKPAVSIIHIDTLADTKDTTLTEQFAAIQDATITALALDTKPKIHHKVANHTQKNYTCGDRCILSLLSQYTNNLQKLYNKKYKTDLKREEVRDALLADETKMREFILFLDEQARQKNKKEAAPQQEPLSSSTISTVDDLFFTIDDEKRNKDVDKALDFLNNLTLWKDEENHPTTFKITEKKIEGGKNTAQFKFTATRNGVALGTITLTRKDSKSGREKKISTWTCTTDNPSITEEQRFQLIAAESLALRLQNMNAREAKKIRILELNENERGERKNSYPQSKFPFAISSRPPNGSEAVTLSQKEIDLIKAHFDAGYQEVFYGKLKLTPKDTRITCLSLPIQVSKCGTTDKNTNEQYAKKFAEIYREIIDANSNEKKQAAFSNLENLVSDITKNSKTLEGADELNNKLTPIIELAHQKLTHAEIQKLKPIIQMLSSCTEGDWMNAYDQFQGKKQANIAAAILTTHVVMFPHTAQPTP